MKKYLSICKKLLQIIYYHNISKNTYNKLYNFLKINPVLKNIVVLYLICIFKYVKL